MSTSYPLRRFKRGARLALAKLLLGSKATSPHFAFVGSGSTGQLCDRIVEAGHRRLLVVTDAPLRELGLVDRVIASLGDISVDVYDGVQPDPTFAQVAEGAGRLHAHRATAVLAIGGGSSIDAAKIIAASTEPNAQPRDWIGLNKAPEDALPLFVVPTTAGTGSEATMGAVITDENDHTKQVVAGSALLPRAVALDPSLMLGLPPHITAATGLDALTHGIEAYLSVWARGTSRETATMAVSGVFRHLRTAYNEPDSETARLGMTIAAYYGGVAINQVNVGNVHAIAHQLGARYHLPHGLANALVLPPMLKTYGARVDGELSELARSAGIEGGAEGFVAAIESLKSDVGLPATTEVIKAEDTTDLAAAAIEEGDGYFSPVLLTEEETMAVLATISG